MLYQDKLKTFFFILMFLSFYSCNNKVEESLKYQNLYYSISNNIVSKKEYQSVLKKMQDTLSNWVKVDMPFYDRYCKIDTLICFNKSKDRCVTALLHHVPDGPSEGLMSFYGTKFDNKWYFFSGASRVLPKDYFDFDESIPLSFKKLHEIAMKEVYSGYLIKKEKGFWGNLFSKPEYEINESFFKGMESRNSDGTYAPCFQTFKEAVLCEINHKWKKPDKDGHVKDIPCFDENNNIILPPYSTQK